jgi:hypothetical protein
LPIPPLASPAGTSPADVKDCNRRRRRLLMIGSCIFEVLVFSGYVFESLCEAAGSSGNVDDLWIWAIE